MTRGDTVWVHPHGKPTERVDAVVDLLSRNERSIALRLLTVPNWIRRNIREGGMFIHVEHAQVEMLLTREVVGPWVEIVGGGHFEITEQPQ